MSIGLAVFSVGAAPAADAEVEKRAGAGLRDEGALPVAGAPAAPDAIAARGATARARAPDKARAAGAAVAARACDCAAAAA
jgi:hypothetical protein